jgi:ABC-2 type transport system ATP-binding protein
MTTIVEVKNLAKRFGKDVIAVDDTSFTVEEGETFGFLGPNGAGKSTTINILTTYLEATGGEAAIAGFNVVKHQNEVRSIIGVVPQELTVDDDLTGRENLQLQADLYGVPRDEAKKTIAELLDVVDLGSVADRMVRSYSGGMRKRLELAEGLINHPRLLFLDEPTVGLDIQTRDAIWGYIRKLKAKDNLTVFLTTHYLEEADEQCDRVAIIDHGKIVAIDSPASLKSSLGGEIISLLSDNDQDISKAISAVEGVRDVSKSGNRYRIKVANGETIMPKILSSISAAGSPVLSVSLIKPNLDQVFLEYTGKTMRDAEDSSSHDMWAEAQLSRRRA